MSYRPPRWIAHRGGGCLAPENTLLGIRRAAALGFRAVEFDVMLSADGTPVLIHDETLERTTNGRGAVAATADADLFRLDAGGGERIPRLDEAAALCRELGLFANIEIKPAAGLTALTAETVVRAVRELWRGGPPLILSSFAEPALALAAELAPELPRAVLYERPPPAWAERLKACGARALHVDAAACSPELLAQAAALAVPVLAYTVNDAAQAARLFAAGVAGLFTDRLDRFAPETPAYKTLQSSG